MTDKHTPGPWIAENGMVYALDEAGRVNRFSVMITGGYSSAPVYGDRIRTTPEELAANARLIAAAPDLLAALQAVTEALNGRVHSQPALSALSACCDAIAKATEPTT